MKEEYEGSETGKSEIMKGFKTMVRSLVFLSTCDGRPTESFTGEEHSLAAVWWKECWAMSWELLQQPRWDDGTELAVAEKGQS